MKKKSVLKKCLVTGMALMMSVVMIGCGSSSMDSTASYTMAEDAYSDYSNAKGFYGAATEQAYIEEYSEPMESNSSSLENSGRKLIKEVTMTVETETFDDFLVEMERKINENGGYKERYTVNGNNNNRYAEVTIRIPRAQLDAFLKVIEGTSNITYRHETVDDVTLQYVDLESHKKMLYAEQERLLEFMSRAEKIEDVITLESRLTEVQYQIESMESQLRTFNNQIEYSTIYLDVNEVVRITPQEPKGMWERITTGFSEDLYEVGEDIKDGFVGFVIHIPSMIVSLIGFAFYVLIAVLIVKVVLKVIAKYTNKNMNADKKQKTSSQNVVNNPIQTEEKEENR